MHFFSVLVSSIDEQNDVEFVKAIVNSIDQSESKCFCTHIVIRNPLDELEYILIKSNVDIKDKNKLKSGSNLPSAEEICIIMDNSLYNYYETKMLITHLIESVYTLSQSVGLIRDELPKQIKSMIEGVEEKISTVETNLASQVNQIPEQESNTHVNLN